MQDFPKFERRFKIILAILLIALLTMMLTACVAAIPSQHKFEGYKVVQKDHLYTTLEKNGHRIETDNRYYRQFQINQIVK